jgi:hypothetical protein
MSGIDNLIRDFRSALPDPTLPPPSAIARAARAAARRSRRPLGTTLALAGGGLVAAALVIALAIVFVASPKEGEAPAEAPLVGWGMDAVIRVAPDPGSSRADAMSNAIAAIETRGRVRDVRGLSITRLSDEEFMLRAPSAVADSQIAELVGFARIEIFDSSSSRLGGGRDVSTITPFLEAEAGLAGEVLGYAVGPRNGPILLAANQDEVVGQRASFKDRATDVAPIRRGTFVAVTSATGGAEVFRDTPALRASDVVALREADGALIVSIRPDSIDRLRRLSERRTAGSRVAAMFGSPSETTRKAYRADLGEVSRIDLVRSEVTIILRSETVWIPSLPSLLALAGDRGLGAELSVVSSSRYGVRPPLQGNPVDLPNDLRDAIAYESPTPADVVVRVLSETLPNGSLVELWVRRRPDETEMLYLRNETGFAVSMPPSNFPLGGSTVQLLNLGVGYPIGRVHESVASVEGVLADGATVEGVVRNGWFIIKTPVGSPSVSHVVARSRDGRELARVDPNGRVSRP